MDARAPSDGAGATGTRAARAPARTREAAARRRAVRGAGLLFLAAFLTYGVGSALVATGVDVGEPFAGVAAHPARMSSGAALMLANSAVVAGIGVLLFPLLREHNERVAVGYLATRVVEAALLGIGVIALFSLVAVSDTSVAAENAVSWQAVGRMAVAVNDVAYQAAMAALGLGSLFFCFLLRRTRLVPRLLAEWGLVGYAALLVGAVLELFGVSAGLLLAVPGGLFEVAFAIWLLAKGVTPTVNDTTPTSSG